MYPSLAGDEYDPKIIYSSQFNQLTDIHVGIANEIEKIYGHKVWFEMSIYKNDGEKTSLADLMNRYIQFENKEVKEVIFTDCKTFEERAKIFPDVHFIVSNRKFERIVSTGNERSWQIFQIFHTKFIVIGKIYEKLVLPNHPFFQGERITNI